MQLLWRWAAEVDLCDVVEGDVWLAEETTMDDESPLADYGCDGECVEESLEELDQVLVVRVLTWVGGSDG